MESLHQLMQNAAHSQSDYVVKWLRLQCNMRLFTKQSVGNENIKATEW